jgi:type II secretory pathway pseudopilin PulG
MGSTSAQGGYTYIGLLIGIALLGATLAATGTLWSTTTRRDKEAELLFVGEQFSRAIASYRDESPAGMAPSFPRSVDDLLDDKRWPTKRRHLRKLFVDPMTASTQWGLVASPAGGVTGVFSLSQQRPLKRGGFPAGSEHFSDATTYRDWVFTYDMAASAPQAPLSPPGSGQRPFATAPAMTTTR